MAETDTKQKQPTGELKTVKSKQFVKLSSKMENKKIKLFAVLLLGLGLTGLQAQQAIPSAGGDAFGSGGSASYSFGQVAFYTHGGATGMEAQGVQQPYEIFVVLGLDHASGINLSLTAYPNPTTDFLNLRVEYDTHPDLSYQLFDINGKLLDNRPIKGNETSIAMSHYSSGTYLIKVIQNNQEVKSFKIIKNQSL